MKELACANHWGAIAAALWFSHAVFEYWVGKTSKVKAGSALELAITGIVSIAILLTTWRRGHDRSENG